MTVYLQVSNVPVVIAFTDEVISVNDVAAAISFWVQERKVVRFGLVDIDGHPDVAIHQILINFAAATSFNISMQKLDGLTFEYSLAAILGASMGQASDS